ncbi:uncharacterized protein LOC117638943 [Thrips palmi]|uniref:Uncharacterized protein LOC117638943 n=1 Tax=Thrips palmi TaxID=161013 RepID=A0A6P8Y8M1_THRPL|nr:uncharacterized protein LOC117638943 [Thrips palmi]
MPSDSEEPTAVRGRDHKCRPKAVSATPRKLSDRGGDRGGDGRRRGAGERVSPSPAFDTYAEDGGFEIDVRPVRLPPLADSREDGLPFSLWDGAGRRPQYLDHDDLDQPPSFEAASGESAEAHHGHGLEGHGVDGGHGRGPVVVRAPPFNSVAIGFLIYLVLLTLLQASIYDTSQKGLLSSLLGPLGLKPSRNRRDMEDDVEGADVILGQAGERRVSILGLEHHDQGLQQGAAPTLPALEHRPVLVAAVLESEDGDGGPRSVRTRRDAPRRGGRS